MEKMLWWNDKGVCSSRAKKTSTVSYMVFGYSILFVRRRLMRVSPRSESGKSPESLFQWPMATARCPPLPHTTAIQRGLSDVPRRSQWLVKVVGGVVVLEVEVSVRVWDLGGASDGI
eukprot:scaffold13395_cov71-Cyclotella_meneghiniana.AAC.6